MGNTCMPCGGRNERQMYYDEDEEYIGHDYVDVQRPGGFKQRRVFMSRSSLNSTDSGAGTSLQSSVNPKRRRAGSVGSVGRVKSAGCIDGARRARSAGSLRKLVHRSTVSVKSSCSVVSEEFGKHQDSHHRRR